MQYASQLRLYFKIILGTLPKVMSENLKSASVELATEKKKNLDCSQHDAL